MGIASPRRPAARRARKVRAGNIRGRLSAIPRPLLLLLLLGALLSVAWDLAEPAFQGPDEAAHYAYVQYLAESGRLPSAPSRSESDAAMRYPGSVEEQEALTWLNLRPVISNRVDRPAWTAADLARWREVERRLPRGSRVTGASTNRLSTNPPLYYAVMTIPYRIFVWLPVLKRIFVLRLFNALFYLATIAFTWLIAGELFGRVRWKQALAAGAVALEPQLAFMSAVINADNLLIALTSGFLYASLVLVRRGPSLGRVLAASLLAAAAVLTHGRGLVTLPVLAVALLAAWIRYRPTALESLRLAGAAAGTVAVAFIAYVLFGKGGGGSSLYGGQITQLNSTPKHFKLSQFLSSLYQFYLPRLASLPSRLGPHYGYRQVFIESFYGIFGSLDTPLAARTYDFLQVLSALGLLGLYTAVIGRWRQLRRAWPIILVLVALAVTVVFFINYVSYRSLLDTGGKRPLVTGRYLLPMISLWGVAIAFTVGSLARRAAPLVGAAILALGVLLSIGSIGVTTFRFYG